MCLYKGSHLEVRDVVEPVVLLAVRQVEETTFSRKEELEE